MVEASEFLVGLTGGDRVGGVKVEHDADLGVGRAAADEGDAKQCETSRLCATCKASLRSFSPGRVRSYFVA